MPFQVCILRKASTGKFYVGHTENLTKRVLEHKKKPKCCLIPFRLTNYEFPASIIV